MISIYQNNLLKFIVFLFFYSRCSSLQDPTSYQKFLKINEKSASVRPHWITELNPEKNWDKNSYFLTANAQSFIIQRQVNNLNLYLRQYELHREKLYFYWQSLLPENTKQKTFQFTDIYFEKFPAIGEAATSIYVVYINHSLKAKDEK